MVRHHSVFGCLVVVLVVAGLCAADGGSGGCQLREVPRPRIEQSGRELLQSQRVTRASKAILYLKHLFRPRHAHQFGRRSRRNVVDDATIIKTAIADQSGCGARLICELHQYKPEELDNTGRHLVQLFDGETAPTADELKNDPKASFQYAAFIGTSSPKNRKICGQVFHRCPMDARAIMNSMRSSRNPPTRQ